MNLAKRNTIKLYQLAAVKIAHWSELNGKKRLKAFWFVPSCVALLFHVLSHDVKYAMFFGTHFKSSYCRFKSRDFCHLDGNAGSKGMEYNYTENEFHWEIKGFWNAHASK